MEQDLDRSTPPDLGATVIRRLVAFADGDVSYLAAGDDGPMVGFAHATGLNAATYRVLLARVAEGCRVVAPDQRGHGFTTLPADPKALTDWQLYAQDLITFLEAVVPVDHQPLVLAGHSMGATVSLMVAAARPDLVRGLVLIEPVLYTAAFEPAIRWAWSRGLWRNRFVEGARRRREIWPSRRAMVEAYRGRGAFMSWPEAMLGDYVEGGVRDRGDGQVELTCSRQWEAATFSAGKSHVWAVMRRIRCPIVVLRAVQNSTAPLPLVWRLLWSTPNTRFETIPGTSHFVPMERTILVADTILRAAGVGFETVERAVPQRSVLPAG